jgi:hypothetical protein
MKSLYTAIEPLPFEPHHWFHLESKKALKWAVEQTQATVVVELGSLFGNSTCEIASWMPEGVVYAVDHWRGQPYYDGYFGKRNYYHQFLSNVIHHGMTERIVPVRMSTLEAAEALRITPQVVYVDAGHTTNEVNADIQAWWPKLVVGGRMVGDDYHNPEVQQGVQEMAQELGLTVESNQTAWWFKEVRGD